MRRFGAQSTTGCGETGKRRWKWKVHTLRKSDKSIKKSTGLELSRQKMKGKTTWGLKESKKRRRDRKWNNMVGREETVPG